MLDSWYDLLAIVPYAALTTWALLAAGCFLVMVQMRVQGRHYLWGTAAFTLLAVFFFSLAITGGSSPLIPRRQLAIPIRLIAVGILITGYGWIVLWSRHHLVVEGGHGLRLTGRSTGG